MPTATIQSPALLGAGPSREKDLIELMQASALWRARFWMKVRVTQADACWEWTAALDGSGYGKFSFRNRYYIAHRIAVLLAGRELTPGLQLDHLCRNRRCVNPAHLEEVTNAENHRRGYWATRTHCSHGHPWDEANTAKPSGRERYCRACRRLSRPKGLRTHDKPASKLRGVGWDKRHRRWRVRLTVDGQQRWIGYFDTEVAAAEAYDLAALEALGEAARLNFPESNRRTA